MGNRTIGDLTNHLELFAGDSDRADTSATLVMQSCDQLAQLAGSRRSWATSPDAGPEGWGFKLQLTLLYPK